MQTAEESSLTDIFSEWEKCLGKFGVCGITPLFLNLDFATHLVFRRYLLLYQLFSRDKVLASGQT